jgi:hypothetical protein
MRLTGRGAVRLKRLCRHPGRKGNADGAAEAAAPFDRGLPPMFESLPRAQQTDIAFRTCASLWISSLQNGRLSLPLRHNIPSGFSNKPRPFASPTVPYYYRDDNHHDPEDEERSIITSATPTNNSFAARALRRRRIRIERLWACRSAKYLSSQPLALPRAGRQVINTRSFQK